MKMKRVLIAAAMLAAFTGLSGCFDDEAKIVEENMIKAADNFEINRRIVFYNGITDSYMLVIEGRCSMNLNRTGTAFNVICKTGPTDYKRHTQVLSDNTSAFVEQLDSIKASAYHYRVTFKPQSILPDIDFRGSGSELITNSSEANQ